MPSGLETPLLEGSGNDSKRTSLEGHRNALQNHVDLEPSRCGNGELVESEEREGLVVSARTHFLGSRVEIGIAPPPLYARRFLEKT